MADEADKADESPARKADIAKVESLSRGMVEAVNARDFDSPLFAKLTSPNLIGGTIDKFGSTTTLSAHLEKFRSVIAESPEYHIHIEHIRTDLDGDDARVYVAQRVTGRPPGLTRGSMAVFTWSRRPDIAEGWWLVANENWRTSGLESQTACPQADAGHDPGDGIAKLKSRTQAMDNTINARDWNSPLFRLLSPEMESNGMAILPPAEAHAEWIQNI